MTEQERPLQRLQSLGYRLTPQRLLVLEIMAQSGSHLGVDQVYQQARRAYPYLDLATVYRTLRLFKQVGVVTEVAIGNRLHYELTHPGQKHHHMVCRACNKAINLSPHYLEELRTALIREFGFEPDLEHLTISGHCADCRPGPGPAANDNPDNPDRYPTSPSNDDSNDNSNEDPNPNLSHSDNKEDATNQANADTRNLANNNPSDPNDSGAAAGPYPPTSY